MSEPSVTAEQIVRALAAINPMAFEGQQDFEERRCTACDAFTWRDAPDDHCPDCPWRMAVEWVASATPDAPRRGAIAEVAAFLRDEGYKVSAQEVTYRFRDELAAAACEHEYHLGNPDCLRCGTPYPVEASAMPATFAEVWNASGMDVYDAS